MKFTFAHNNITVLDLDKSLYFIADPDGYWIEIMPFRENHEQP